MNSFPLDLSSLIVRLEYQRKKILENEVTAHKMCYCRMEILNNFTVVLQKLGIRLSARLIKFPEDFNIDYISDMKDMRSWFIREAYTNLFSRDQISDKMVLLFKIIQKSIDDKTFEKISKIFKTNLVDKYNRHQPQYVDYVIEQTYDEIKKWYNMVLLNLLSIQINCDALKEDIFENYEFLKSKQERFDITRYCPNCVNSTCVRSCPTHDHIVQDKERVSVFVTPEIVSYLQWIEELLNVFKKYHNNYQNIEMIFDFRMFDEFCCLDVDEDMADLIRMSQVTFKNVYIKNFEHVNFNKYKEEFQQLFKVCSQ